MKLSAPTQPIFLIALVLAVISLLGAFGLVPAVAGYGYWLMTAAWGVLAVACVLKGL